MCPPGYHHNGFVAPHALGHMITYCKTISYIFMKVLDFDILPKNVLYQSECMIF